MRNNDHKYHQKSINKGFTLIELLVVIGIMAIIGGIGSDLFVTILKGANKANVINEVKQNGNLVLGLLERQIRNAKTAQLGGLNNDNDKLLILTDLNDNYIQFHIVLPTPTPLTNGKITIATGSLADYDQITHSLNSNLEKDITNTDTIGGINISDGEFTVICPTPGASNPPYVHIEFNAEQGMAAPSRQDYIIGGNGIKFETTVSLRTYSTQGCPTNP